MKITLHTSASEINAASWAALRPRPRGTRAWFLTSEDYFTDMRHRYLAAWDGEDLKAILTLFDHFDEAYFNVLECFGARSRQVLAQQRFWALGSRLGFDAEVIGDAAYAEALLAEAVAFAKADGAAYLAANFCEAPLSGWEEYLLGDVFHKHVFRPRATTFDEHLAALSSNRRRVLRKDAAANISVIPRTLSGNEARFNALRSISCERQGGMNHLNDGFFAVLAKHFGDDLILLTAGPDDDWTGAHVILATPEEFCGFSIGVVERDKTYFNLLVREPLKLAIETGRGLIDLGAACDEAKRSRGAEQVPLSCYLRPLNGKAKLAVRMRRW